MKTLIIALLSISLMGAVPASVKDNGVIELTCHEVNTALRQLEIWAGSYKTMLAECQASKWQTHTGQCMAATMTFDSIVDDAVRIAQFKAKMECKES
jgi:hypothetical protein